MLEIFAAECALAGPFNMFCSAEVVVRCAPVCCVIFSTFVQEHSPARRAAATHITTGFVISMERMPPAEPCHGV